MPRLAAQETSGRHKVVHNKNTTHWKFSSYSKCFSTFFKEHSERQKYDLTAEGASTVKSVCNGWRGTAHLLFAFEQLRSKDDTVTQNIKNIKQVNEPKNHVRVYYIRAAEVIKSVNDGYSLGVCVCCSGLYRPRVGTPEHEGEFIHLRSKQKTFKLSSSRLRWRLTAGYLFTQSLF